MTYVFTMAWAPIGGGEDLARRWLQSAVVESEGSPACEAVKNMRDPDAPQAPETRAPDGR